MCRAFNATYLVLGQYFDIAASLGMEDLLDLEKSPPCSKSSLLESPSISASPLPPSSPLRPSSPLEMLNLAAPLSNSDPAPRTVVDDVTAFTSIEAIPPSPHPFSSSCPETMVTKDQANHYTRADDEVIFNCSQANPPFILLQVIVAYLVSNGHCKATGGIGMWQQMEERQVVRGATWQSLKERFLRSIRGRLDSFDLTAEARQQLLKGGHASATSSSPSNTSTTVSSSPTLFSASSTASSNTATIVSPTTTERAEGGPTSDDQSHPAGMEPNVVVTVASSVSICPICLEKVNSKHMSRHKRRHENLLPPPCNLCGKKFGTKDHLARHLLKSCPRLGNIQIIFT